MGAPVVHYEIMGKDGPALREFYGSLFGWDFDLQPAPRDYGLDRRSYRGRHDRRGRHFSRRPRGIDVLHRYR